MIPQDCVDPRRLHLVVMPTEACHFRCTYCYEDFRLGRMPPGLVSGLKTWLEQRAPELHLLELSWFGGEPLLALDLLRDVQGHALDLACRHPRLNVRASLTTNGHRLEASLFRELLDLRVTSYQITLDGPAEQHDRTRLLAGGGATFERIWTNLLAMHAVEADFSVLVRVHVHRENLASLPELLDHCAEAWGGDRRFRLVFKALFHPGRPDYSDEALLGEEEACRILDALRERALALNLVRTPEEGGPEHEEICYAAKANSFVVRSDGVLNKCSVALSSAENQVGRLHPDGTVTVDGERMQHWMRGLFSGDAEERRCPMIQRPAPVAAGAD